MLGYSKEGAAWEMSVMTITIIKNFSWDEVLIYDLPVSKTGQRQCT